MIFLGVDIGTSSSKAALVDEYGALLASATRPHAMSSPKPSQFEHDAEGTWWADFTSLVQEVVAGVPAGDIGAVCV
ncbi:MAG TPA: FGGY family carbohydrate kinase, partial [Gaiellaceae bacterium]